MMLILLDSYYYLQSYLSLKSKNMVKFYVYISPIFSCRVTYINFNLLLESYTAGATSA